MWNFLPSPFKTCLVKIFCAPWNHIFVLQGTDQEVLKRNGVEEGGGGEKWIEYDSCESFQLGEMFLRR